MATILTISSLITVMAPTVISQQVCRSDAFLTTTQFSVLSLGDDFGYLEPNMTLSVGYQVIVPDMRFDCHGYISGWSALTWLNSNNVAIDNLNHVITFQLWRPSPSDGRVYTFVGSQRLDFIGASLRAGLTVVNGTQFFRFTSDSAESDDERLYFQPGDVVGWYIHTLVQSTERPLTIVYRDLSRSGDPSLQPVDMYTAVVPDTSKANTPPPCELSLCSGQFTRISSVIPYVTVDYVQNITTATNERRGSCVNSTVLNVCITPAVQNTTTPSAAVTSNGDTVNPYTSLSLLMYVYINLIVNYVWNL